MGWVSVDNNRGINNKVLHSLRIYTKALFGASSPPILITTKT
jgi:hypothetical protein